MAWTEGVAGFSEFELKLVRGDTKQSHTIGTYPAGGYQATFSDGFDINKSIRVGAGPFSVLGCRQDKFYILSTHTGKVDLTETDATNCIAIDVLDVRNVPQDLQLDSRMGYGRFSPFASPYGFHGKSSLVGIDIEKKRIANSKIGTDTTINMMGDSRFVLQDDDSARTSFDVNNPLVTFTPNASDVFVILPSSVINIDVDTFGS